MYKWVIVTIFQIYHSAVSLFSDDKNDDALLFEGPSEDNMGDNFFLRRHLFYFCMGSCIVCMSNDGGHLGFAINKKYKLFEEPSNDYSYI